MTREDLVLANLPLVDYAVRELASRLPGHVGREDLVSAGQLALTQAATAFDPTRGVPFPAYARTRIRGALIDELRTVDWASRGVRSRARSRDNAVECPRSPAGPHAHPRRGRRRARHQPR